jgi:hypothetical protein
MSYANLFENIFGGDPIGVFHVRDRKSLAVRAAAIAEPWIARAEGNAII